MLGFRGASRYYAPALPRGLRARVRAPSGACARRWGSTNVKVMIPFCRTPEEGRRVLDADGAKRARARRATASRST